MVENNLEEKNKMMQSLDKILMNIGVLRIKWTDGKMKIVSKFLKDGMIRNLSVGSKGACKSEEEDARLC